MRSSDNRKFIYEKNQLIEVVCQLRFPTILSIDTKAPADFQETIRAQFPRYSVLTDRIPGADGKPEEVRSHTFLTEDGLFKLTLTKRFIALSTMRYTGWERFAHMLDEPLAQFIAVYQPAYFERVGLRYLNAVSREKLGLTDRRWSELLQPRYLAELADPDADEADYVKCAVDIERKLGGRVAVKLHAGLGNIRRQVRTQQGMQTVQEPETRFILDLDLFTAAGEKCALPDAAETLEQLHAAADRVFSEAITDTLHEAMEPVLI